ncbi:NADH:ubiquinone oxidoreductase [Roseovarius sp. SYSU LYC5161]|uniref:NADH:ubiquinone oxidoreductase n=1 Tax=Roseovarius halophilus (ex Wu et al. 2025) TaxID=3376060 RepID=UPI00399A1EF8
MSTIGNLSSCRVICWALAAAAGLTVLAGTAGTVGVIAAFLLGVALAAVLGIVFVHLVCTDEAGGRGDEIGQSGIEKSEKVAGMSAPASGATGETARDTAEPVASPAPASMSTGENDGSADAPQDVGQRPRMLDAPRDGKADNLKEIKGIGPKLEALLNEMGVYHFDQIAAWDADEVTWLDANLQGFKGRVSRDSWVAQATILAAGGDTEFSRRVDDGDVY